MTSSKLLKLILSLILLISQSLCLSPVKTNQLHRTFSESSNGNGFGMRELGLMFTGVVSGILLFLCIMYNFKWRRESGWNFSFAEHFTEKKTEETQTEGVQTSKGPKRPHHASIHNHHRRTQGHHTHHTNTHQ